MCETKQALAGLGQKITGLETRISSLDARLDARVETLDRDLREWAKITMRHNTDIARLKDKAGLTDGE